MYSGKIFKCLNTPYGFRVSISWFPISSVYKTIAALIISKLSKTNLEILISFSSEKGILLLNLFRIKNIKIGRITDEKINRM